MAHLVLFLRSLHSTEKVGSYQITFLHNFIDSRLTVASFVIHIHVKKYTEL